MARKLVAVGVLYLASVAVAGVLDARTEDNKGKEPEKKPNIVKDYVCLRDGELCHPDFGRNRGLYVTCSNGIAWEQQCAKCTYHPINCPTRSLWFDGEKGHCTWASPKLASQPCIDHFPSYDPYNIKNKEKDSSIMSEQEALFQSLLPPSPMAQMPIANSPVASHEKNQWQQPTTMDLQVPSYFKSPKYDGNNEPLQEIDEVSEEKEMKAVPEQAAAVEEDDDSSEEEEAAHSIEGKSGKETESEFPSFLNADDSQVKIIKLNDPVYTLVDNPDGSGKQVLVRVSQPFVLEESARSALLNLNSLRSALGKE